MPRAGSTLLPLVLLAVVLTGACSAQDDAQAKQDRAPQVGFVVVKPTAVPLETTLGGRTVAFESSEVRPQVSGLIRARNFVEGGYVTKGQTLFQIDPSLYRAAVNEASANLNAARAGAEAAEAKAERFRPLAEMEAIARQDYTDALAHSRQARAAVAQNAAALDTARVVLRYTTVPAPISGRIGRSLFTVGTLVSSNQADPLALIQRLDPIYVDMQQSSAEILALRRGLANGSAAPKSTTVRLKLEDGSDYGLAGTVQFSEVAVNPETGTVTLRARFPNPRGELLPGMFVQASFAQSVATDAFLVPQQAVQRDVGGDAYVLLVGAGNKALRRKITTARSLGADWVVTAGLAAGDKVITQGINSLKQGMQVKPVPAASPQRVAPASGKPS